MTRYTPPAITPADRQRAESIAREAGRSGAARVPTEALFPNGLDPTDTALVAVLSAFDAGQLERKT